MGQPYGNYSGPPWVGVLIFGIFMMLGGTMAFVFVATGPQDPFFEDFNRTPMAMGAVLLIFGVILILIALWMRTNKVGERAEQATQQTQPQPVERRIVQEVVKVRCSYCGTLNDVNDKECTSCGGTL